MIRTVSLEWRDAEFPIEGDEIVAIGDVHGQADLLAALLDEIERQARPRSPVVFLGDLIDRGPDSRGCLRLAAQGTSGRPVHYLMGNHEAMFLAWLESWRDIPSAVLERWGSLWLQNGGASVLREFGRDGNAQPGQALLAEMSPEVRRVLDRLTTFHRSGETIFVHAGLSPSCLRTADGGYVLDEREFAAFTALHPLAVGADERHPLWIREEFLRLFESIDTGPIVVHGHTPAPKDARMAGRSYGGAQDLRLMGRRLNLDAGSGTSGEVAAAIIRNHRYRIIFTSRE
jgi:serine/threonine protein phosphatase 1